MLEPSTETTPARSEHDQRISVSTHNAVLVPEDDAVLSPGKDDNLGQSSRPSVSFPGGLPVEILTDIFGKALHIQEGEEAVEASRSLCAIAGVCRLWKSITYATPEWWRNASYIPISGGYNDDASLKRLLWHVKITKDRLTHASIVGFIRPADCYLRLAVLRLSIETLTDLELNNLRLAHDGVAKSHHPDQPFHESLSQLLQLIASARRLQRLYLRMDMGLLHSFEAALVPKDCEARPREVHLVGAFHHWPEKLDLAKLFAPFLRQLVSKIEKFTFNMGAQWDAWGWRTLLARQRHLRVLSIHLSKPIFAKLGAASPFDMPALQEARLFTRVALDALEIPWDKRLWLTTPALTKLCTFPSVAAKMSAPLVECAHLMVTSNQDVKVLARVLSSWPQLRSLTVSIVYSGMCLDYSSDEILEKVVNFLTPGARGKVYAPNLQYLGFIGRFSDVHKDGDPEWAARPWRRNEEAQWHKDTAKKSHKRPLLPAQIVCLERQRRKLHEGLRVRTRFRNSACAAGQASPVRRRTKVDVRGRCQALQAIKLKGVRVEDKVWKELLDSSRAEVTCFPAPDNADQPQDLNDSAASLSLDSASIADVAQVSSGGL